MIADRLRRLAALEARKPQQRRVVIIGEHDPAPEDATFVIRLVPARFADVRDER